MAEEVMMKRPERSSSASDVSSTRMKDVRDLNRVVTRSPVLSNNVASCATGWQIRSALCEGIVVPGVPAGISCLKETQILKCGQDIIITVINDGMIQNYVSVLCWAVVTSDLSVPTTRFHDSIRLSMLQWMSLQLGRSEVKSHYESNDVVQ